MKELSKDSKMQISIIYSMDALKIKLQVKQLYEAFPKYPELQKILTSDEYETLISLLEKYERGLNDLT